eukprot:1191851-Prorocentrum_minimum.AAC.3
MFRKPDQSFVYRSPRSCRAIFFICDRVVIRVSYLDVEHGVGADLVASLLLHQHSEVLLASTLHCRPLGLELGVVGLLTQTSELVEVTNPLIGAQGLSDEVALAGVAERKPAALGHAVGLVLELLGHNAVEVLLGPQRGKTTVRKPSAERSAVCETSKQHTRWGGELGEGSAER